MTDKSNELNTSLKLINNKLHFEGHVDGNTNLSIDYTPPLGDNLGYTSLELLLLSLSSCIGSAVLTFLRKMQKNIGSFEIQSRGFRKDQHPTGFKSIILEIKISSPDVTIADMDKVIHLAEETYCPVWAMLKGNVEVIINSNIQQPES